MTTAAMSVTIKMPMKASRRKLPKRKPRELNAYKGKVMGQAKKMYMA